METIVSVGFEKLWDLFSKEHERLSGVSEQITELKADLEMLASFLRDVDAKKQTSELARDCVNKIKEITYDAEDVIETYLLKGERSESNGMKNHIKSLACIPFVRRDTALQTRSISKRISRVIQLMQTSGIKSNNTECGYSQALLDIKREMRHTFSSEYESNLVGLEKKVERLVELVEGGSSHAVSITGLGGLGKTTLARQVFNHYTIKHHFDGLAWVCVSQDFKRKDVWQTILGNLSPGDKDLNLPEDELQKKLVQLLETKKVLIIFDDLWKKQDWDRIKPMFPAERKAGWKVLLTSRNDAIHPHCMTFKPELLTHDECWILLQLIAFPKNDTTTRYIIDEEMVEMAKEMVTHCGRLPLAVKVLGGLLAAQPTLRQWKLISENIKSHIMEGVSSTVDDSSSVNHILSLSFEGLPSYLKQCLLYLASLPKNYPVRMERLAYIWAAEGIKKPRHYEGATIRDVADLYIEELVMRNLVSSERDMETSRFEYCQLHDLMREMCLLKAKEENFLKIVSDPNYSSGGHSHASSKSRRLIISGVTNSFNGEREIKNSKVRSLLFISAGYKFSIGSNFLKLQPFLRVLDLSGAKFKGGKLPSSIGKLIHLKYLSLANVDQTHLPSWLRNLKSLLYLNLGNEYGRPTNVPNVFKEMLELRYLCLPTSTRCQTKLELGNLLNLESLHNFSTKHSSVTDLHHMTRLRSLSININGEEWGLVSSTLCKLGKLEDLRLESSDENANHLKQRKLSDLQHLLSHLTNLTLIDCRLEEDPMPILEKLLQLNFVILGSKSYVGKRMVCSIGGFPKLQTLTLGFLEELEEWIVEEGSMPLLHTLNISYCDKLKELPDGLRFITSLKELHICTEETEFRKKVSRGEDYYKIQHIPLIQYIG